MTSTRYIELLAPARNAQTARAAIDHGADAVYIGAARYGARAAAGNSADDIAEVVRYARPFGVKVYVTLNTLLTDAEQDEAEQLARQLYSLGVDAFIVQDERLARRIKDLPLHSSTQMDNRTADDVRRRQEDGYLQTVLARELTLEEIRSIHEAVPAMPLEVFVHGAVCVSYSGRCFASEVCYGRSANRGECAQFCRMPYTLEDAEGNALVTGHLLSMRDMKRSDELERLLDVGVSSLKIEGRLKDEAYVKNVTAWYRQKLDAIFRRRSEYCRSSQGRVELSFTPDVERTFQRGYTDYFLNGRQKGMACLLTPKSMGQRVGTVKSVRGGCIVVASLCSFSNGDGLCYDAGGRLAGFRVNRAEGNHLYPHVMPEGLREGTVLYRNQDMAMERALEGRTAVRKLPLKWTLDQEGDGFTLTAELEDGRCAREHFPWEKQPARSDQSGSIAETLSRLGNTPYESAEVRCSGEWFIPRSILTEWRRRTIEKF